MLSKLKILGVIIFSSAILGLTGSLHATGYTITTSTNGFGSVSCNPTNSVYPQNATVVVTATPAAGWFFSGWSGSISGTLNPTNIFLTNNINITGNFAPFTTNVLTLVTNGNGTITLNPPGGSYASNTTLTATAAPAVGWIFVGWSGTASGLANPLSLTLQTNASLIGTFAELPAFDLQPQSSTNPVGATVNFTSDAVGTGLVSYQWYFGGSVLMGATSSSLSLTNAQSSQAGNYWVVATNLYGMATSSIANLVVTQNNGSTNVVNTPTDAALRAAIAAGGWVSLACNGTITLTNTITITQNVSLDASTVNLVLSGGGSNRIFYVMPGVILSATNLILANGVFSSTNIASPADGGAIYNNGTVVLTGCSLTNNEALNTYGTVVRGGAIFNNGGTLGLYGCSVSNNAAFAATENTSSYSPTGRGGAIYNTNGTIVILNSVISSNLCEVNVGINPGTGYGGAIFQISGSTFITNSVLATNAANGSILNSSAYSSGSEYGGAVASFGGTMVLDHSQLIRNSVQSAANTQSSGQGGAGGAIWNAGTLILEGSTVASNFAASGYAFYPGDTLAGGIYNTGTMVLSHSSVFANAAIGPFGISSSEGYAGGNAHGGGIYNAGQLAATNSTIAINSTVGGQGGYSLWGYGATGNAVGGGFFNLSNATFVAMNVTIASNYCIAKAPTGSSTPNGFTAGDQIANTNGSVQLHNTLLAYGDTNGNCYGTITDIGYNMNSDGTATFNSGSSYNYTNPQLEPLANYSGPTWCMALASTSPAIGFGDSAGAPSTDQRYYSRPLANGIDIGAYQFDGTNTIIINPVLTYNLSGTNIVLRFTAASATTYSVLTSSNLMSWVTAQTIGPFGVSSNVNLTFSTRTGASQFFKLEQP